MKNKQSQPAQYHPESPEDFIGMAHDIARMMKAKAARLQNEHDDNIKYVLTGDPGIGKTTLAQFFATELTGERLHKGQSLHVESVNGRNVDLDLIRRWQRDARYIPEGWCVKIVNELDTSSPAAQDLLLTYLDELPNRTAFIGTSNAKIIEMDERFHSRLQQFHVKPPATEEIAGLLRTFRVPNADIKEITEGCAGNVRAALLDAQSTLDIQLA